MNVEHSKKIGFSAAGFVFVLLVTLNVEHYVEAIGWNTYLTEFLGGDTSWLIGIATQPLFAMVGLSAASFILGLRLGDVFRRQPSYDEMAAELYDSVLRLKQEISSLIGENPEDEIEIPQDLNAELMSIRFSLAKVGFDMPLAQFESPKNELNAYQGYFAHLLPLLRDGHASEARKLAQSLTESIDEIALKATSETEPAA